jgi:hypothetical protein
VAGRRRAKALGHEGDEVVEEDVRLAGALHSEKGRGRGSSRETGCGGVNAAREVGR